MALPPALIEASQQIAAGNPAAVTLQDRLALAKHGPTLIFDGVCNLCNVAMRWYYDRLRPDTAQVVYFMWAQHEDTQAMLKELGIRPDDIMRSWAYVSNQVVHRGSSAWFQAMQHLKQPWRSLAWLDMVPEVLREGVYGVVAANRYRTLGKSEVCQRPAPGMKKRFLHPPISESVPPAAHIPLQAATKARLLVVGMGPAGMNVVRSLYKEYTIIAVEPKDYYEFTPGILRGAIDPEVLKGLQVLLKDSLKGLAVQHVRGEVVKLSEGAAEVRLLVATGGNGSAGQPGCVVGGEGEVVTIPFDYAVIAAGSQYAPGGEWKITAADTKSQGITLEGRQQQLGELRHRIFELRGAEGTAIVVGGGLVGVELAAELSHYVPGLKVVLTDRSPVVLKSLPSAQDYVAKWLKDHKVEMRLGQSAPCSSGDVPAALGVTGPSMVLNCAGIKMRNSFAEPLRCLDERGSVRVNRMMQVLAATGPEAGLPVAAGRIFALGDCVAVEGANPPLDKLTYPADAMADVVVTNLHRAKTVQCLRTCPGVLRELRLPLMIPAICSLGPKDAVFVLNDKVRLTGWAAAKLKHVIETTKMGQFRQELIGSTIWSVVPHF